MTKNVFYKKTRYGITCISPYKKSLNKIFNAVEIIKKIDRFYFNQVCKCLPNIFIVKGKSHFNGYFIDDRIWFSMAGGINEDHLIYLASLLVHESQHMVQANKGKKYFGARAEKGAYLVQRKFLMKVQDKELSDWFVNWLDKQFVQKWWVNYDKKIGKGENIFEKTLKDYKNKKLKLVKVG